MNIFVLDKDPVLAAQYQCDVHVRKMCLESTQLICTAATLAGAARWPDIYKPYQPNGPCPKWVRSNKARWAWHLAHTYALFSEFEFRFGKTHKSKSILDVAVSQYDGPDNEGPLEPFLKVMKPIYFEDSAVKSYHNFYRHDKVRFATWDSGRPAPQFMQGYV